MLVIVDFVIFIVDFCHLQYLHAVYYLIVDFVIFIFILSMDRHSYYTINLFLRLPLLPGAVLLVVQ